MSNSNTPAHERHLKKIYDCLNIGSNKKAVQEVDRLPKNVKDLTVFKALKALASIRMGKRRQAFEILDEIDPKDELDEMTLQTMTSCYKESVDVARIVDLYETASAKKPQDAEVMARLFMAYVRVFNLAKQKEVALKMQRTFAKDKRLYSFWYIMSLVMESHGWSRFGEDIPASSVCLSIAERMCEKMIDEERSHEEIELYLTILRKQDKYQAEYKFLTGPVCLRLTDHLSWFNRRRAYLCLDLKMYSRAFKHYFPTLIQEYPDQTEYYQGLIKSALLLDTENSNQQQPLMMGDQQQTANSNQTSGTPVKSSSALAECFDIVEKQCQFALESLDSSKEQRGRGTPKNLSRTSSSNPHRRRILRGPFMARIHLYDTIMSNESTLPENVFKLCRNQFLDKFSNLPSMYLDFFQSFSRKIICFYDLECMLKQYKLTGDEMVQLLGDIDGWISQSIELSQIDGTNPYDVFHIRLNYHMLSHALRKYQATDGQNTRLALAKEYIDLYDQHRELGKQANTTEFLPVDHYCLLAINTIMTNSVRLTDLTSQNILTDPVLMSLIVMAENAIINSPSNHQIKLILLKLYAFVGASKHCSDILIALDIKHFQIDTLGHLLNPVLYNTGNYNLSKDSLDACLEFYAQGLRECYEGLTTSYRDGRFSKIEEISLVLRRLRDSLNAVQCILLKGVVANLNVSTLEELDQAYQSFDQFGTLVRLFNRSGCNDKLIDSRDFRVLKSLHFETNQLIQDKQQQTFEDEQTWLKIRYFLLQSVLIQAHQCIFAKENTNRSYQRNETWNAAEMLNSCDESLKERSEASDGGHYSFLEPEATPFRWGHANFDRLYKLARPLATCRDIEQLTKEKCEAYTSLLDEIVISLENQLASCSTMASMKQTLTSLTISLEFISYCCTSLLALSYIDKSNPPNNWQPINATSKQATSQVSAAANTTSQSTGAKAKSPTVQLINKTEAQLTKLANSIKSFDLKSAVIDKLSHLDPSLLSSPTPQVVAETKGGVVITPLIGKDTTSTLLTRVKEKLADSYSESLKEIEGTCRRKIKLLRIRA